MLENSSQEFYFDFPMYDRLREIIRKQENLPAEPYILSLIGGSSSRYELATYGLAMWIYEGVKPKIQLNQINGLVRDAYQLMCQWYSELGCGGVIHKDEFMRGDLFDRGGSDFRSRLGRGWGWVDQDVWDNTEIQRKLTLTAYSTTKGSSFLETPFKK